MSNCPFCNSVLDSGYCYTCKKYVPVQQPQQYQQPAQQAYQQPRQQYPPPPQQPPAQQYTPQPPQQYPPPQPQQQYQQPPPPSQPQYPPQPPAQPQYPPQPPQYPQQYPAQYPYPPEPLPPTPPKKPSPILTAVISIAIAAVILLAVFYATGIIGNKDLHYKGLIDPEIQGMMDDLDLATDNSGQDYKAAKDDLKNAENHLLTGYDYFLEGEQDLSDQTWENYYLIFDFSSQYYLLVYTLIFWMEESDELLEILDRVDTIQEAVDTLPKVELFIGSCNEISVQWLALADTIREIMDTNEYVTGYFGLTDTNIRGCEDVSVAFDAVSDSCQDYVMEIQKTVHIDYVPTEEKELMPQGRQDVSGEIIDDKLADFFNEFDKDNSGTVDIGECEDFYYWVEKNIVYRYDDEEETSPYPGILIGDGRPGSEYWQSPSETYAEKAGDCEDMSILEVAFYNHFGITAYMATVNAESTYDADHAICIAYIGNSAEEYENYLGNIVYYEFEDGYYMLVDNAYSDSYGSLSHEVDFGMNFKIQDTYTLEEAYQQYH